MDGLVKIKFSFVCLRNNIIQDLIVEGKVVGKKASRICPANVRKNVIKLKLLT
jgi:hypothetical protein